MVLANIDGAREVLVVSKSLADVDALMRLLTSRYLLVTVTVLILASILSICLAIHFSRPFQHLNKSAQQMAAGDYKTCVCPGRSGGSQTACRYTGTGGTGI